MKYLSSNEIAEAWNITPTRVIALARKGKIEGALRIGGRWMIPSKTLKPSDGRTKQAKKDKSPYRFPVTIFGNYTKEEIQNFSKDDKDLHRAQVLYCNYKLNETKHILSNLLKTSKNLYIKIGSLYLLCYTYWHLKELDNAFNSLFELRELFEKEFPHKEENRFILLDILSVFFGTKVFEKTVELNPNETYSEQGKVYFTMMTTCKDLMSMMERKSTPNIDLYEIICDRLESENYTLPAMYMHCYLGGMYTLADNNDSASIHMEKAVNLAVKHKYYVPLLEITYSSYSLIKPAISKLSSEEQKHFEYLHTLIVDDFTAIVDRFSSKSIANKKLNDDDYKFIHYVICDIPNKQIGELEKIAESTVNKKFLSIYEKLGITGKKELFQLSITSWFDKE